MSQLADTIFWSHYGHDVIRLAKHLQTSVVDSSRQFGLVRKYPRLVEIARLHGVHLPNAQAEWACCFEDANALEEADVMILDDIVIRGTMLDACRRHFETKHNCRSVTAISLARNRVQHDPRLRLDYCARELDDLETHRFCSEIVLAIQSLGKPYDVDHPQIRFSVSGRIEDTLKSMESLGEIYSITSAYAREQGVSMWSVLPRQEVKLQFSSTWMGQALDSSVLKWRLFYRESDKCMTVCPILVSHCRSKDLARAWRFHGPAQPLNDLLSTIRDTKSCDVALAEFRTGVFLTEVLLGLHLVYSSELIGRAGVDLDEEDACVTLGRRFGNRVCSVVRNLIVDFVSEPPTRSTQRQYSFQNTYTRWSNPEIADLRRKVVAAATSAFSARPTFTGKLAAIFETLQLTLETEATGKLHSVSRPAEVADRLLFGFTPGELSDLVSELSQDTINDADLLSLAIDIADTNGVLVPKTTHFQDEVGRYLAYGEDTHETCIPLLQASLAEAFSKFLPRLEGGDRQNIVFDAIELEKALVFALAEFNTPAAVRSGYPLSRALYCDGVCRHPRGQINLEATLHGHYLSLNFADYDSESPSWLTRWLVSERILVKADRGLRCSSMPPKPSSLHNVDSRGIVALADRILLARYLQRTLTPLLTLPGTYPILIFVTSCINERRFLYALRADLKEFFQSRHSPYSGESEGLPTLWDQLDTAFRDLCSDPRKNRRAVSRLLIPRGAVPAASVAPHELLYKVQLFTERKNISHQIADHFDTSASPDIWKLFELYLEPLLREMQTATPLDNKANFLSKRTVWLSEAVANLWKALRAYLDAFNVGWLFPKTTNEGHLESVRRSHSDIQSALSRLSELRNFDIQFGANKASDLLPDLNELHGHATLGAKPNPTEALALFTIYKATIDSLRTIYQDFYQNRSNFLADLESVFPTRTPAPHEFRLMVDCRGSSPDASKAISDFAHRMALVEREFRSALMDHSGFEQRKEHGDSLRISGEKPGGTLACIRVGLSLAKSENFVRMTIGHDLDSVGISPDDDPHSYSLTQRLVASIDGDVKKHYDNESPGFVLSISESALQQLGGPQVIEKLIGETLTQSPVQAKGEVSHRTYCHAVVNPNQRTDNIRN